MTPGAVVLIFGTAWFALALICGMLAEYHDHIISALSGEPMPGQRFREGQPVDGRRGR
ncbi:hypothetical protein MRBLMC3_002886 [Sphingobium sp. LMC3-1-1.1]|uniref:hypothetical protein n=1 Tax=Sphingobium sp. LMC3-1-1.1 TaxID=3135241 RepID=UPI003440C708